MIFTNQVINFMKLGGCLSQNIQQKPDLFLLERLALRLSVTDLFIK